jgi:hypothetical protein
MYTPGIHFLYIGLSTLLNEYRRMKIIRFNRI